MVAVVMVAVVVVVLLLGVVVLLLLLLQGVVALLSATGSPTQRHADRWQHWPWPPTARCCPPCPSPMQVAALALATHRALLPFLRDEAEVLRIVQEHAGARTRGLLVALLRLTSWLHWDPFASLAARLRGLQADYGAGFRTALEQEAGPPGGAAPRAMSLRVTSCFYRELFEEEGAPALAAAACCSQDRVWLEGAAYAGVHAGLTSCMARGDEACCFRVERVA